MTVVEFLSLIALGLSALNAVLLLLTFVRAGRWKDGEDARQLINRVTASEGDITAIKAELRNVATKADVAALGERLSGVEVHARSIERGVERIEGHLMRAPA